VSDEDRLARRGREDHGISWLVAAGHGVGSGGKRTWCGFRVRSKARSKAESTSSALKLPTCGRCRRTHEFREVEHEVKARALAERLRANGVEVDDGLGISLGALRAAGVTVDFVAIEHVSQEPPT